MDQVPVDIDQRRFAGSLMDNVSLPDLFVHGLRCHCPNHPNTLGPRHRTGPRQLAPRLTTSHPVRWKYP